jgi:hypothetical protein
MSGTSYRIAAQLLHCESRRHTGAGPSRAAGRLMHDGGGRDMRDSAPRSRPAAQYRRGAESVACPSFGSRISEYERAMNGADSRYSKSLDYRSPTSRQRNGRGPRCRDRGATRPTTASTGPLNQNKGPGTQATRARGNGAGHSAQGCGANDHRVAARLDFS